MNTYKKTDAISSAVATVAKDTGVSSINIGDKTKMNEEWPEEWKIRHQLVMKR
jgi:hypothetical protein